VNRYENIEAFVLAGGKSSRMGEDKGLMLLGEKPMIAYVLDTVSKLNLPVKIIANSEKYKELGFEVVKDIVPGMGPMGGLYTAFHYNCRPYIFLLSCDSPFITLLAAERLLNKSEKKPVTTAEVMTKINPLFAVYHHSLQQKIGSCMANNQLKMKDMILSVNSKQVNMDDLLATEPFLFFNINNKTDFEKCSELLKQKI